MLTDVLGAQRRGEPLSDGEVDDPSSGFSAANTIRPSATTQNTPMPAQSLDFSACGLVWGGPRCRLKHPTSCGSDGSGSSSVASSRVWLDAENVLLPDADRARALDRPGFVGDGFAVEECAVIREIGDQPSAVLVTELAVLARGEGQIDGEGALGASAERDAGLAQQQLAPGVGPGEVFDL